MIKMIYASDVKGVIGKDNALPWHLPSDLKRFKELTLDDYVVMGRKTYESLPERYRPLPDRMNIVLSTSTIIKHPDVITISMLRSFMTVAKMPDSPYSDRDIWIIGGSQLFESCLEHVDEIHHTRILHEFEGDTIFDISKHSAIFEMKFQKHVDLPEDKGLDYHYNIYKRRK